MSDSLICQTLVCSAVRSPHGPIRHLRACIRSPPHATASWNRREPLVFAFWTFRAGSVPNGGHTSLTLHRRKVPNAGSGRETKNIPSCQVPFCRVDVRLESSVRRRAALKAPSHHAFAPRRSGLAASARGERSLWSLPRERSDASTLPACGARMRACAHVALLAAGSGAVSVGGLL